jgi:two-component system chemotaxis response regulator CheB
MENKVDQDNSRIVVVGASAGGMEALKKLVAQFPQDFPAPIFIVRHMSADTNGEALLRTLNNSGKLPCHQAYDWQKFQNGNIYLAPPDQHMLIAKGKILITKGARENRSRPAIDCLFRSAAVAYCNRVIGVILTGYLNDGTSGMLAIKRCDGICIAQDPADAAYPDMPKSVLANVEVDYCVPLAEMGGLLSDLTRQTLPLSKEPPQDLVSEAKIAQRAASNLETVEALGDRTFYICPDCGGALWQIDDGKFQRFRCHVGHAFTMTTLIAQQTEKIEETLWAALRMFEERQNILITMNKKQNGDNPTSMTQRIQDSQVHIDRIRNILMTGNKNFN